MNEDLKKRTANVRKYLEEQFKERPLKWWQITTDEYIPTRDMGSGKKHYPHNPEETIVKFDFKGALKSGALFFMAAFMMFYFISSDRQPIPASFWMMMIIMIIALFLPLLSGDKRGDQIVFNKTGFRISTMPRLISWEYLTASYIRKDNSGEAPSYYLLVYYYDETKDEFKEIELADHGLNMSKEDIALQIEYWKMVTRNDSVLL